uniref:Uncharacterized protein n=1 Tax=Psilocybe cubensis TaxID=181762 RepID=A0A8H7Y5K3_PSICU
MVLKQRSWTRTLADSDSETHIFTLEARKILVQQLNATLNNFLHCPEDLQAEIITSVNSQSLCLPDTRDLSELDRRLLSRTSRASSTRFSSTCGGKSE